MQGEKGRKYMKRQNKLQNGYQTLQMSICKDLHEVSLEQLLLDDKTNDLSLTPWNQSQQFHLPEIVQTKRKVELKTPLFKLSQKRKEVPVQQSSSLPNLSLNYKQELPERAKSIFGKKMTPEIIKCKNFHAIEMPQLLKKNKDYEERKKLKKLQKKAELILSLGSLEQEVHNSLWRKCTYKLNIK